jgi:hypothetical protein
MRPFIRIPVILFITLHLSACVVVSVADTLVSTTVKVGGAVVGTAVDVAQAGVHVVTGSGGSSGSNDKGSDKNNQRKPGRD